MPVFLQASLALLLAASYSPACEQMGHEARLDSTPHLELRSLAKNKAPYSGEMVKLSGYLREGSYESDFLCASERAALEAPLTECYYLTYNWDALGAEEANARRVLRQWRGARVELVGSLHTRNMPPVPRRLRFKITAEHRNSRWVDNVRIQDVSWIRLLDLERPRAEYCLEHRGPTLPSPAERYYRRANTDGEKRCLDTATTLIPKPLVPICIDPVAPTVWVVNTPFPFVVAEPFANRDIQGLAALTDKRYLYTLSNRRLYYWDGEVSTEVATEPTDAEVDRLSTYHIGQGIYRLTQRNEDGEFVWNALVLLDRELDPLVLWESTEWRLERFEGVGRELRIAVREEGELQQYLYAGQKGWERYEWPPKDDAGGPAN